MTIERLQCFVSAATHLNFTRAAQERHMAQTAMSRQIALLEEELGCKLFYREHRFVTLTAAGKKFYQDMVAVLTAYDESVREVKQISQTMTGGLHIGIGQYESSFVSELVQEFCHIFPSVEITISQYRYQELIAQLLRGKLDVAFALPISAEYLEGQPVEILNLFTSDVGIVVPHTHPMAHADKLSPDFWQNECLITLSEDDGPASLQNLRKKMESAGWHADNIRQANTLESELLMAEAGMGVILLPRFLKKILPAKLVMPPASIPYSGKNQFVAISRKDCCSPCLEGFLKGITTSHTLAEWVQQQTENI